MTEHAWIAIASIVMAGLTMAVGAIGAALGESRIASSAMDAVARQPEAQGPITRNQFVALAMVESTAIFCLVIALVLLFATHAAVQPRRKMSRLVLASGPMTAVMRIWGCKQVDAFGTHSRLPS